MYRLANENNLSQNTIIHIFKRNTVPSIYTLEAVCRGSGITLSQFFAEEDSAELSPERKAMFDKRLMLTPAQAADSLTKTMDIATGVGAFLIVLALGLNMAVRGRKAV